LSVCDDLVNLNHELGVYVPVSDMSVPLTWIGWCSVFEDLCAINWWSAFVSR
jgi:hypothetical protein